MYLFIFPTDKSFAVDVKQRQSPQPLLTYIVDLEAGEMLPTTVTTTTSGLAAIFQISLDLPVSSRSSYSTFSRREALWKSGTDFYVLDVSK